MTFIHCYWKPLNSGVGVCSHEKTNQYSLRKTNRTAGDRMSFLAAGETVKIPVCIYVFDSERQMFLLFGEHICSAWQTFALTGAEAATLLARGCWALVNGQGLLVTLTARDFTMHLVGQVPQQTHAVLYQLQTMERKQLGLEKRRTHNPLELKTT